MVEMQIKNFEMKKTGKKEDAQARAR